MCRLRPATGVLLVVDDAHLADDGTAEACAQLARAHGAVPLLVVAAYRPEGARPSLAQGMAGLERAGRAVTVDLEPLDRAEVVALLAGAGTTDLAAPLVDMAQGNPFFALELARGAGAGRGPAVPRSVWDAVTARFLDLDEPTIGMLRRLAVAGDDLDTAGVLALTGLGEADAFALLDAALDAGALVVSAGRYRFRHDLVRVALAEQVPPHHRIAMHRDAARRLAAAGAAPALVAAHWIAGGRGDEAVPWLLEAARRAVKVGAFGEALRHLDTLLEHDPRQLEALHLRGDALEALGDRRAPAAFAAAAEVAGSTGDPLAHDILSKQALAHIKQGDPPGGVKILEGDLAPTTIEGKVAHALAWAGAAVLGFAEHDMGTAKAAEVRRLAMQAGDRGSLVIASWAQAAAAHARGDLWGSVERDLLETASLPDLAVSVFDGHLCITQRFLYGAKPYPEVISFADRLLAEADRLGAERGKAYATNLRGEALLLCGRLDEADETLVRAARLSRETGGAVGEAHALQRRAEVALWRDEQAQAAALLDEALAVARECNVGFHLMDRIYGTKITAARDPELALAVLEDAESSVQGPLETCPGCRITLAVPAAIASARAGDMERLAEWVPATEFLANVVMRLPAWHAALEEVHGHRALALGEPAASHFTAAADGFRKVGQPLDEARCVALAEASS